MTLQELADQLNQFSKQGDLSFKNIATVYPVFSMLSELAPFCDPVTLKDTPVVMVSPDQLSIKKSNTQWGILDDVPMEITFTAQDQDIMAGLQITLPPDFQLPILPIPRVSWFSLDTVIFSVQTVARKLVNFPLQLPVTGFISANIKVGDIAVPIKIGIKSATTWFLECDKVIDFPNLAKVISLLGNNTSDLNLPDSLNHLTEIALYNFTLTFNPGAITVTSVTIEIGSSSQKSDWEIIPGAFTLQSYRIALNIANPIEKSSRAIGGLITATMHFGGSDGFDLDISAIHPPGGCWEFKGETGKDQPLQIGALIGDLGSKFGVSLPEALTSFSLNNVLVDFNTASGKDFQFKAQCGCEFTINDKPINLAISIGFTGRDGQGFDKEVKGSLTMGAGQFNIEFNDETKKTFSASWAGLNPLEFSDIAEMFGSHELVTILAQMPSFLKLSLQNISFTYDFTVQQLILTAKSINYGKAVFIAKKLKDKWAFIFELAIDKTIGLQDLPLVGAELVKIGTMEVGEFRLIFSTADMVAADLKSLNDLIKAAGSDYPTLPEGKEGLKKGAMVGMKLTLGPETYPVTLGTGSNKSANPSDTVTALAAAPANDTPQIFWINLQKSIGPVYFNKVGVRYQDQRLLFSFMVSLITTGLKSDLDGLSIETPLDKFDPHFNLDGLSITYQSGPIEISGGFVKADVGGITEYNGEALIKTGTFNLMALGSYANVNGRPSLFIFVLLKAPLGGPPCFFVNGVAGGFGYNRNLKLPTIDEVADFPLVSGFVPQKTSPFSGNDPGKALQVLTEKQVVGIAPGEDWLACGVAFTSFEMINSFALLAIEFGTNLEVALLGLSTLEWPPTPPTLVKTTLALDARLLPDQGILAVEAKLTPDSYLLSPDCRLTGGFAFYTWFSPHPNQGDFVVTLGGYHPNFKPPAHYPQQVPRLGFNWVVTSELTIKGEMYFALTPTCLMAGGSLEALWQSGNLKAWFDIGADFLIAWKPFHYEASMYISFGVSYTFELDLFFFSITETISVSLGADLSIWGPDFSGVAHIHLWIISFSISFGAGDSTEPQPIPWSEFKDSFLPVNQKANRLALADSEPNSSEVNQTDTVCSVKITNGLVQDLAPGEKNSKNIDWIVSREGTIIATNSLIPAKDYTITIQGNDGIAVAEDNIIITNQPSLDGRTKDFGVGLVEVDNDKFSSRHQVAIKYIDGSFPKDQQFEITAILNDVPKSLWEHRTTGYDSEAMIKNTLVGFTIKATIPAPDQSLPIDLKNFQYSSHDYQPRPAWSNPSPVQGPEQPAPIEAMLTMQRTISNTPIRENILQLLAQNGLPVDITVDVADIAQAGSDYIFAPPLLRYTYWKKAS